MRARGGGEGGRVCPPPTRERVGEVGQGGRPPAAAPPAPLDLGAASAVPSRARAGPSPSRGRHPHLPPRSGRDGRARRAAAGRGHCLDAAVRPAAVALAVAAVASSRDAGLVPLVAATAYVATVAADAAVTRRHPSQGGPAAPAPPPVALATLAETASGAAAGDAVNDDRRLVFQTTATQRTRCLTRFSVAPVGGPCQSRPPHLQRRHGWIRPAWVPAVLRGRGIAGHGRGCGDCRSTTGRPTLPRPPMAPRRPPRRRRPPQRWWRPRWW